MIDTFSLLFTNILPLYGLVILGVIAGKKFDVGRKVLGAMAIYLFMPIVVFGFIAQIDMKASYMALPVIFYALSAAVMLTWYSLGKVVYKDNRANLLAMCVAMGNTGYFGLPIVFALFPTEWVGVYIIIMMGGSICESTLGFFIAARGNYGVKESIEKLVKFPVLYAVIAGLMYNLSEAPLSDQFITYWGYFKGAYVVIGMMLIGSALSNMKTIEWDWGFLGLTFLGKSIAFPLLAVLCIMLDQIYFQYFGAEVYKLFYLMTVVPSAANIAAYAVEMNLRPEKAATTVLIGTVYALFMVPLSLVVYDLVLAAG